MKHLKKVFNKKNGKYASLAVAILEDNPIVKAVSLATSYAFAKAEENDIDLLGVAKEFVSKKEEPSCNTLQEDTEAEKASQ